MYGLIKVLIEKIKKWFYKRKVRKNSKKYVITEEELNIRKNLTKVSVSVRELQDKVYRDYKKRNITVAYLLHLMKKEGLVKFKSPRVKRVGTKLTLDTYNSIQDVLNKKIKIGSYTPYEIGEVAHCLFNLLWNKAKISK